MGERRDPQRGAALVEYALLVGLVAVAAVTAIGVLGQRAEQTLGDAGDGLGSHAMVAPSGADGGALEQATEADPDASPRAGDAVAGQVDAPAFDEPRTAVLGAVDAAVDAASGHVEKVLAALPTAPAGVDRAAPHITRLSTQTSANGRDEWTAWVWVEVGGSTPQGTSVTVGWSGTDGVAGQGSCDAVGDGRCRVIAGSIPNSVDSVTFTVVSVTAPDGGDHDPAADVMSTVSVPRHQRGAHA